MGNDRQDGLTGSAGPRLEARCAWCGEVRLGRDALRVHRGSGPDGLAEFSCPRCDRLNLVRVGAEDLSTLLAVGVAGDDGPAPFELLEDRSGPPITWDDLIDFHEAIAAARAPSIDARTDPSPEPSGYERDAA